MTLSASTKSKILSALSAVGSIGSLLISYLSTGAMPSATLFTAAGSAIVLAWGTFHAATVTTTK